MHFSINTQYKNFCEALMRQHLDEMMTIIDEMIKKLTS